MKAIAANSTYETDRNGWATETLMVVDAKADGTANRARRPRSIGIQISRHPHGHVRIYKDGVLIEERYVGTSGPAYVGPVG